MFTFIAYPCDYPLSIQYAESIVGWHTDTGLQQKLW